MTAPVFTGINHLCVVTRDLDRAVRTWADRYGVGPWRVMTYEPSMIEATVGGRPTEFGMRVGLAHIDESTRIEIIQPTDDRSPYAESLEARGGADHIHHVRMDIADYGDSRDRLEGELGLSTVLDGTFQTGAPDARSSATYLATEQDLGFIVEVAELPPGVVYPEPDYVYPPAG